MDILQASTLVESGTMIEGATVYAILYIFFCLIIAFPPTEMVSAGLTVDKIFAVWLGDEQMNFVEFHVRRVALTVFVHSCLPIGFFMMLEFQEPGLHIFGQFHNFSVLWRLLVLFSCLFPLCTAILVWIVWRRNDWAMHPVVRHLKLYDENWRRVASTINAEYRRIDKFSVELGGIRRVIVTDSWVFLVSTYQLALSQQADVRLTVVQTDEHAISHHSDAQVQFINISVENVAKPIPSFTLRLNSLNYSDLRAKLQRPVQTARDVIIHQSLDERFVEAFEHQAHQNPPFDMPREQKEALDLCMGCSQVQANVKLEKNCLDTPEQHLDAEGNPVPLCRQCYCRPMWCVACMGRWFASRQDAHHPERWMASKSPCPTCRAVFCVLDVCVVL